MSLGHGAKIVTDGLAFLLDFSSPKCTQNNRTGILNTYSSTNAYVDAIGGRTATPTSGIFEVEKTYYTIVGLTYPEGSQAAPWAGRNGVTPGISNTSAGKLYDFSRDLNYIVFDEDTNTWVPDSYFNGERINGHCYDTYDGAPAQHVTFQADFDNISSNFPNATHIVVGSHAAENNDNDSGTLSRLQSIGLPDSHIGVGRPEYVLVGKVSRPSTWHYVRENVNSAIGVMNVGLPLEGKPSGVRFNSNTKNFTISPSFNIPREKTLSIWIRSDRPLSVTDNWEIGFLNSGSTVGSMFGFMYGVGNCQDLGYWGYGSAYDLSVESATNKWSSDGNWHNAVITMDSSRNVRVWVDGEQKQWLLHSDYTTLADSVAMPTDTTNNFVINSRAAWNSGMTYVDLGVVMVYEKALTDQEIKQNFEAHRARYGI
jgi:hypothetical protein